MRSIVTALRAGRLIELPSAGKETSLRNLAHLIEAVPDLAPGIDLAEEILKREGVCNSGRRRGVACPHARVPGAGDLVCALGWSPAGIEYGAEDGHRVHLVVMYFIPDVQKHAYLKEISGLAEAVRKIGDIQTIAKAEGIPAVRDHLLGWVSGALEAGESQVRARMIRLETRQTQAGAAPAAPGETKAGIGPILPVILVALSDQQRLALCENKDLAAALERDLTIAPLLKQGAGFDRAGYRLVHRATILHDPARPLYEYFALKLG